MLTRSGAMLGPSKRHTFDVAIVGGGPAGLTAAVYLARFLRSVVVFDTNAGRARLIPRTHNCPGFPEGIAGKDLLGRLRNQAKVYGAEIATGHVGGVEQSGEFFLLDTSLGMVKASRVVLATGVVDKAPPIPDLQDALAKGFVRFCPVCDAYEPRDRGSVSSAPTSSP